MAKYGSDDVGFILIDGYDVRGYTTTFDESRQAGVEDTTVLGDAWQQQSSTGVNRYELSQEGFYDDAVDALHDALVTLSGAPRVLAFGFAGNAIGQPFTGVAGPVQAKYDRAASTAELHKASAEYQASGAIEDGIVLHAHATETTASGDTTGMSVDNGAATAGGAAVYLAVSALNLDGGTGLTIKVRHSTNNATWADLATFAVVTSAPASQRLVVAGAVNRYLAVSWSIGGSPGAGRRATFMVGAVRR